MLARAEGARMGAAAAAGGGVQGARWVLAWHAPLLLTRLLRIVCTRGQDCQAVCTAQVMVVFPFKDRSQQSAALRNWDLVRALPLGLLGAACCCMAHAAGWCVLLVLLPLLLWLPRTHLSFSPAPVRCVSAI